MKFSLKRKKYAEAYCGKYEYGRTLERVEYLLKEIEIDQNKIDAIEYIMKVIRLDLQSELLTRMIYPKQYKKNNFIKCPLPRYYETEHTVIDLLSKNKTKIDFSNKTVLSLPYSDIKLINSIKEIAKNGFIFNKENIEATYYKYLDICIIENGFHHTAVAIVDKKGEIEAWEYDTSLIFSKIDINEDVMFYYIDTFKKIKYEPDVRIALLYKLAKMKWEIENNRKIRVI